MESKLLSAERMERMLTAHSVEEAARVLVECGWPELGELTGDSIDAALAAERQRVLKDLSFAAPDAAILDVFKLRHDYHNVKVLLKAEAMGTDPARLLVDAGRVPVTALEEAVRSGDLRNIPGVLRTAIRQARDVLGTTNDPQLADFTLDRAYFEDLFQIAQESKSTFLQGYVRISVDVANLRSAIRTLRMGKGPEFLKGVLFSGGEIPTVRILSAVISGAALQDLYARTPLAEAAEVGTSVLGGGALTRFEKLCDDAVGRYLARAKLVGFGEAPVIGYLAAKETELTNLRMILSGRMAGLDADTIRERLRESYV